VEWRWRSNTNTGHTCWWPAAGSCGFWGLPAGVREGGSCVTGFMAWAALPACKWLAKEGVGLLAFTLGDGLLP